MPKYGTHIVVFNSIVTNALWNKSVTVPIVKEFSSRPQTNLWHHQCKSNLTKIIIIKHDIGTTTFLLILNTSPKLETKVVCVINLGDKYVLSVDFHYIQVST